MKYQLDQTVFYMKDNKIHSATVLSRAQVECRFNKPATEGQKRLHQPFGPAGIQYATVHGVFNEEQVFASKEELLASL